MNAVNDPHERSVSMKESVDAEEEEERAERIRTAHILKNYERQKQSTRTLAYILISFLLCAGILGASAFASSYLVKWALDFTGVASTEFEIDVTIPEDATIETVAAILSENNIINDPKFFKAYADFTDKIKNDGKKSGKEFIPGKYTVSSNMTYSTLLSILQTRNVPRKTVSVRIIEGMTAYEIGELLEENNICFADDFRKYYKNILNIYDFERRVKENSLKFNQLEGYLFPDTYEFYVINAMENGVKPTGDETPEEAYNKMKEESEENAKEAAKKMYANFNSKMTRAMYKKMGEMHLTLDETIALASIVQKEAADTEDMGKVASVFLNRIRNSAEFPFLQSDVTVLYVENDIKPFIEGTSAAKNRIYNAYNTYVCRGIPSGAVCNPGIDAINAVIDAPDTPYLYFCANKETGEIYYAQTHEEHEQNLILAGLTVGDSGEDSGLPIGEGGEIE
ncbi:MAG: endolytic transglycosylase MltG [Ruminiclostridium sp.]|nr:endolytic transglycosylase MltG [Ruminiclostridium sp.]